MGRVIESFSNREGLSWGDLTCALQPLHFTDGKHRSRSLGSPEQSSGATGLGPHADC